MKPFLLRLTLFTSLQLLIVGFVLLRGNPRDENHYYLAMLDKLRRMEQTEGPRLLLVGGSNLAFGMNCQTLQETGHTPINLGLNAGLGLDFYLRIVEEHVREGDIIILSPEYELFSTPPSASLQKDFVTICPELAHYLDVPSGPRASWKYQMDHQALTTIHAWVHKAFNKRRQDDGAVYARKSFNSYGDLVAHWNLPSHGEIAASPIAFDPGRMREATRRLNAFAEHCRNHGAEVYYSYPPMPKERFAKADSTIAQFRLLLDQELLVSQIDEPRDHVYETDQFFDTNYHLKGKAATERTRRLRDAIESYRMAKNPSPLRTATTGEVQRH